MGVNYRDIFAQNVARGLGYGIGYWAVMLPALIVIIALLLTLTDERQVASSTMGFILCLVKNHC